MFTLIGRCRAALSAIAKLARRPSRLAVIIENLPTGVQSRHIVRTVRSKNMPPTSEWGQLPRHDQRTAGYATKPPPAKRLDGEMSYREQGALTEVRVNKLLRGARLSRARLRRV